MHMPQGICLEEYVRTNGPRFARTSLRSAAAKLETTVYPPRSTPIPPKLHQNPFQTIPNKLFFGRKKNWSAIFFEIFGLFGTFTALERSENGLGRSGIIRRHSEMTWNAWNSLKIIKDHSKIMRKHLKIDQKSSMGTKGLRV